MTVQDILEELKKKTKSNEELRQAILATEGQDNYLTKFCKICQEQGYEVYPIDVVNAGEEAYAAMRRSTNGGGENSPLLEGEDDLYAMFLEELR